MVANGGARGIYRGVEGQRVAMAVGKVPEREGAPRVFWKVQGESLVASQPLI
jgi:hypothetical protein